MEKKKHKHPDSDEARTRTEPENGETSSTNQNLTASKSLINMNETDENIKSSSETLPRTVLNDQPYIETETLRPTVSTDLTSPEPERKISVKEMGIHMTKRSKFDEKEFARTVSIDETYYSSVVQPLYSFHICILLLIAM